MQQPPSLRGQRDALNLLKRLTVNRRAGLVSTRKVGALRIMLKTLLDAWEVRKMLTRLTRCERSWSDGASVGE